VSNFVHVPLGSFPELNELLPPRGQYAKEGFTLKNPSSPSPGRPTLFTPDTFSNGHAPNRQQNTNIGKGHLFQLNGRFGGGRDSVLAALIPFVRSSRVPLTMYYLVHVH
jgi:hypothetical protein